MSKRLEELYTKYLSIKNLSPSNSKRKGDYKMFLEKYNVCRKSIETPKYEIGELFIVDGFIFLLIGEVDNYYTGYKVSEWVDFATSKDLIFEYDGDKYFAILEHELFVPKDNVNSFIGKLEEKYIDILFNYEQGDIIPSEFSGLTIPEDEEYVQNKFRIEEMREVRGYIANQFLIFDEELEVLDLSDFKQQFVDKIKSLNYPKAAYSSTDTAQGENFILKYDKSRGVLTLLLFDKNIESKIIKIIVEGDEFLCKVEDNMINFDIIDDFINLDYLANKIKVIQINE